MDLLAAAQPSSIHAPTIRHRPRDSLFKHSFVLSSLKTTILAILAPFLIAYFLPSVKFFCLQIAHDPRLWSFYSQSLARPYLFGLLNFIIVVIVAISLLHHKAPGPQPRPNVPDLQSVDEASNSTVVSEMIHTVDDVSTAILSCEEGIDIDGDCANKNTDHQPQDLGLLTTEGQNSNTAAAFPNGGTEFSELNQPDAYDSRSQESVSVIEDSEIGTRTGGLERRLSSSRFANRKAVLKSSHEQSKSLRISRPVRKNDTLEATWKAISEGRHPPLNRHHRKSETWDATSSPRSRLGTVSPNNLHKGETFDTAIIHSTPLPNSPNRKDHHPPRLRRREPSIGREELNNRVESFIDKFNEQIRLQRQESLLKYVQAMVDRSA